MDADKGQRFNYEPDDREDSGDAETGLEAVCLFVDFGYFQDFTLLRQNFNPYVFVTTGTSYV